MILKQCFDVIAKALFPNRCICCGEALEKDEFVCDYCHEMMRRVSSENRCLLCGLDKNDGCCNNIIFHFEGCVAPFYNEDIIQKAFYGFKLSHKEYACEYFAQEMAKCVKNEFSHIKFDAVAFIPMTLKGKLKRGFNQSEILARRIAELLELPLLRDVIACRSAGRGQHNLDGKQRFINARGLYEFKHKIKYKNILLVDDIKTTGATLDECARQLLFAGAHHIYCVTALVTEKKREKGKDKNGNRNRN